MEIKNEQEIKWMRESGQMLRQVLIHTFSKAKVGVTTKELAKHAEEELKKLGGKPAFLGYQGFPSVICISLNDEVVHGIPSGYNLAEGDILSMDFGVNWRGMITDSARTAIVGAPKKEGHIKLVKDTETALLNGIDKVKAGAATGDIGAAIAGFLKPKGYGIVRDLVGHGVGHKLHEPPEIPNFGNPGEGTVLKSGMTIAIEPMVNVGKKDVYLDNDGWTIKTKDGSLSAHFEDTVLVTEDGYEVLTRN